MNARVVLAIFLVGFAFVWHINWLAIAGVVGAIVCLIIRAFDQETGYIITAAEVEKMELARMRGKTIQEVKVSARELEGRQKIRHLWEKLPLPLRAKAVHLLEAI